MTKKRRDEDASAGCAEVIDFGRADSNPPVFGAARWPARAMAAAALAITLTACNKESPPAAGHPAVMPAVAAAMVTVDGYRRLSTLPAPIASFEVAVPYRQADTQRARAELISLTRSGNAVRAILAWNRPAEGSALRVQPLMRSARDGGECVGWELLDVEAGKIASPLRTAGGCLSSAHIGSIVSNQALYWADFPAPSGSKATLLLGSGLAPMADLTITVGPPLRPTGPLVDWAGSPPAPTPGDGALPGQWRNIRRIIEAPSGQTDTTSGNARAVGMPSDVLFAFDSDRLTEAGTAAVKRMAAFLAGTARGQQVRVVGHTDDQGTDAYNLDLSRRRAKAVAGALTLMLAGTDITLAVDWRGEAEPLLPNRTADGTAIPANQARNRRVALEFAASPQAQIAPNEGRGQPDVTMPDAKPAPNPAPAGSLASAVLTVRNGTIRADVIEARRIGGNMVLLRVRFAALDGHAEWGGSVRVLGENPYNYATNETMANVILRDPATGMRYHVLDEGDGYCLGTRSIGMGEIFQDPPFILWGYFPALPNGVGRVDIELGRFGLLRGVPLS
jgi:outer membrane protein OmpA-like peptidoglycan-associated protein